MTWAPHMPVDFVVYSSTTHEPSLAVEVKAVRDASDHWADAFWRNYRSHRELPSNASFLLALPESLYYWRSPASEPIKAPTDQTLKPYLGSFSTKDLSPSSFELAVKAWLSDLVLAPEPPLPTSGSAWVGSTGLFKRIQGGVVERVQRR